VYEFPTSFGQRRMWLLAEMDPGEPTYNITWALWLDGPMDIDALQRAWDAALMRHEALRTTFRNDSGVPVQVIEDEPAGQPLQVSSVEGEAAALALIRKLARIPFDLATGPLARATLVQLKPDAHVLAVVMHHIVADGWSFRILFDEISKDYEAIQAGGEPDAGEPEIQFADYAIWEIEHAEEGGQAASERFWRSELADATPTLPLPVDQPYPARQTFAGDTQYSGIDADLAGALREYAARTGTTLFAVLLAAYAVVLARLSGSDDIIVAVPMAARIRPETESVVGLLMNTVPIRVRIDRNASLGDLVKSVHTTTTRALSHQELPFARVVELVRPDRDPARLPLAQVMFAMEESWAVPDRGGLRWRPEPMDNGTAKFELELTVTDALDGLQVRINRNCDVLHAATARLAADAFAAVLRHLRDRPDTRAAEVQIMSAEAVELVTKVWPDAGPVTDPQTTAVARLWAAIDNKRAGTVAQGSDGALTGDGVRNLALRIAAALEQHGVGMSDRVGILLPRGARLLPAILGVWSVGASYVPMDPIYPPQRLAAMLDDSGAAAVIIDSTAEDFPTLPTRAVVDLNSLPDEEADQHIGALPSTATAVTIFTSGSTGRPKAVSVTQGGVGALLDAVGPLLALGADDIFLAMSSFAFDIALVELLAPVLAGGQVVVADSDQVMDAARLRELLADSGATAMQATPAGWRMLMDAGGVPDAVRLRMTAGEPLPRDLADAVGAGNGTRFWNLYGPTETTIYSSGHAVDSAPIEIGSIIAGTRLYVLDDQLRPVPPGVFGEVYIGGAGVANGYHGLPAMTAARFVPDPFSEKPGARLYKTGDVGRWRASGRVELAGRADRQIKIRGYRIESGEVEAALRSHDDVAQAVVAVRGSGHDVRLVGYVVTRSGADEAPAGLREHLQQTLPDYMVPGTFVVLPALPLTGSGKIDYRALPEPNWGVVPGQAHTAPRTPVESRLASIVAELLKLPGPVSVTDNFFALGGHSLTATRLMARIRDDYGVDLPIRTLFSDPTLAALATAVDDARGGAAASPAPTRRAQPLVPADGR
jgi:amino acid adenylation domain-containing protein